MAHNLPHHLTVQQLYREQEQSIKYSKFEFDITTCFAVQGLD